jgi:hypothetical protein
VPDQPVPPITRAFVCIAMSLFLGVGCSRSADTTKDAQSSGCDQAQRVKNEIVGVSDTVSLYGLVLRAKSGSIRDGDVVKIVWRMTGKGPLQVLSRRPDGTIAELTFGPTPHEGSSYDRPGDEWGTGFRFDQPGCWKLEFRRSIGQGVVRIHVES